ncbi:methyltransferase [Campylobacter sp. MIT 12-8780]|uniref:TylF/MycF/NovP-related O-methyltransferase n=1 Tax=unclassified Campylobacter TaxID=2593542 RepID=UPI00115ECC2A|nr:MULTISPECIES: TylF/MycF/NovP-related O-methyltransferase [unclassified Campylobacter]NDJ28023.1 methyltransferase [Campylobacter sp. MIT 19-121]TQR40513.1 methyltransferase [Campylobacter sp. MIT 12-8780]
MIELQEKSFMVQSPQILTQTNFDQIFVASVCGEDIIKQLKDEFNIAQDKIINPFYQSYYEPLEKFLAKLAQIFSQKDIKGSIAELGVYQGDTAKRFNKYFPDKSLYLFDTFEGYAKDDIEKGDNIFAKEFGEGHLSNTSKELVLSKMPNPQKVIIKQGWFPQTTQGLENEKFCLVNLDPDLYNPVLEGLEFFYPRLVKNGVLCVAGYFSLHSGVKKAVDEFSEKYKLDFIPLAIGNWVIFVKT